MPIVALLALALALSLDAFVAAVVRGGVGGQKSLSAAIKIGAVFGATEAFTPLLGYGVGRLAKSHHLVAAFDHWIAFVLLSCLGVYLFSVVYPSDRHRHKH